MSLRSDPITTERLTTDILVIGSGAGGSITAATLAEAGYAVIIAEEGPDIDTGGIATHTPQAMQLLYRNAGLSPIFGNVNIAFTEGRCVGGSTEINSAFWHRTPPDAVARWCETYQVRDLSIASLYALLDEIEPTLGITALQSHDPPRSSAYLKRGAERLGWAIEEVPRAQRTDLQTSQFAPGAKNSMSRTYIPRAMRAGAKLLPNCQITQLHYHRGRFTHAEGKLTTSDGTQRLTVTAGAVFVCGGPIQTPKLLRASGIKKNVGDNLHIHPMIKVAALFDEQMDSHQSPLPIYQVTEFWPRITLGGSVFTPGFLAMTLAENWATNEAAFGDWRYMALYYAACSGSNRGTVRVLPVTHEAVIQYNLSRADQINLSVGLAHLGELLFATGARKIYPALRTPAVLNSVVECQAFLTKPIPLSALSLTTVHAFSSCPMGENRAICATDSFGKMHGFENIYIADASLIPDSPGVNPQGTVMALALRNARHFIAQAGKKTEGSQSC